MEQAYINGVALSQYGVVLLKGWREAFLLPANNKDYVQNESRLEHGIRVDASLAKKKEREITLQFFLEGATDDDYIDKLEAFINLPSCKEFMYGRKCDYAVEYKRNAEHDNVQLAVLVGFV